MLTRGMTAEFLSVTFIFSPFLWKPFSLLFATFLRFLLRRRSELLDIVQAFERESFKRQFWCLVSIEMCYFVWTKIIFFFFYLKSCELDKSLVWSSRMYRYFLILFSLSRSNSHWTFISSIQFHSKDRMVERMDLFGRDNAEWKSVEIFAGIKPHFRIARFGNYWNGCCHSRPLLNVRLFGERSECFLTRILTRERARRVF